MSIFFFKFCSYFTCATPNVYCKGTVMKLEDSTIVKNKPHTHEAYCDMYTQKQMKQNFRSTLVERSRTETIALRSIYDEESIR